MFKKKKKILKDTYLKHVKNSLPQWGLLQIDKSPLKIFCACVR